MKSFKTSKGTELPISDIKGKPYLQVAYRIVWFREEHPDWCINTEIISHSNTEALVKATILDGNRNQIATAHKTENKQGFGDFLEKAETGSIGRVLALCGYGTQFAEDLDEGERLADSPMDPVQKTKTEPQFRAPRESRNTPSYDERTAKAMAGPMSEKQKDTLKSLALKLDMSEIDKMDFLSGRGIDPKAMTKQQASDCIGEMLAMLKKPASFAPGEFDRSSSDEGAA